MKKILLIDTNTTPFNEAYPVYPIGIDYLRYQLHMDHQFETTILDLTRMGGPLTSTEFILRKKRSQELIKIAHPDFQAELEKEAKRRFWP